MKKGWKIFFKVLYYFFTFGLGLVIALALPRAYRDIISYDRFGEYIEAGDYVKAVDLVGGLYNEDNIYQIKNKDDSEFIIFETVSLTQEKYKDEKDDKEKYRSKVEKSYLAFLANANPKDFNNKKGDNYSKVLINGKEVVDILPSDYKDEEKKLNSIPSLEKANFISVVLNEAEFKNINSIEFIGKENDSLYKYENLDFNFTTNFFNETTRFVKAYNDFAFDNKFTDEENQALQTIFDEIHQNNGNIEKSGTLTYASIVKAASRKAVFYVLMYFILIYIVGDFLVGGHYIIKFFKWIYHKIRKKTNSASEASEALTRDFFAKVIFKIEDSLDLTSSITFDYENVKNREYNFKCVLTKSQAYLKENRVHAGVYQLKNVDLNGYEIINLPDKLEVKGYKLEVNLKIKKKEENNL